MKNSLKVKTCKRLIMTLDLRKLGETGWLAISMRLSRRMFKKLLMNIYKDKLNHHSFFKKEKFHNSLLTLTNGMNGWLATSIVKAHKMLNKQQASIYLHILLKAVWSISKRVKFLSSLRT